MKRTILPPFLKWSLPLGFGIVLAIGIAMKSYAVPPPPPPKVDTLLSKATFGSGVPSGWSADQSWKTSTNGYSGINGSLYCAVSVYNYQNDVLTLPAIDARSYAVSNDSVWLDFDLCWQYNSWNLTYGDDSLLVTTGTDVLLGGTTSDLETFTTSDTTVSYDPPTGTSFWRHYHILVPVSSRTWAMQISFIGIPHYGASNPAIDNVAITGKAASEQNARIDLSRTTIALGNVRVGTTDFDTLKLISNGHDLPIGINSSLIKAGPYFTNDPTGERLIPTGTSETDTVFFYAPSRGAFHDSLIISTNSDDKKEQYMGVYLTAQGVQAIFSTPHGMGVAFGNLRVGRTTQKSFVYSNTGDDTLFLDQPYIEGDGFSLTGPTTLALPPGRSDSVIVQFAPTEWQSYEGTIYFNAHNDVTAPSITLTGVGVLPQLSMSSTAMLGSQRVGGVLQSMVTLSNTGDDTLNISCARLRQPLTVFALGSYGRVVPPGATDTLIIMYAPTQRGFDTTSLVVRTDDPNHPTGTMTIMGQGIQGVFYPTSGSVFDMGHIRMGYSKQQTFTFTNIGDDTLFLQNPPAISGCSFSILADPEVQVVPPGASGEVLLQFAPRAKRLYSGTLSFDVLYTQEAVEEDGDGEAFGVESLPPEIQTITITLQGNGTAPQIEAPAAMMFGTMRVDLNRPGTVTVTNTSPYDTLHIFEPSITQPGSVFVLRTYDESLLPGETGTFHMAYFPTEVQIDSATLNFTTDDPTQPAVSILLTGIGALPHMTVPNDHDTVDLGQVRVNSSTTQGFVVSNIGTWDLVLSEPATTGATFTVANFPPVIAMGTSNIVSVTFTPTTTGPFTGTLRIWGDDPVNPTAIVYLKGTGINSALAIEPASVNFGTVPVFTTVIDTVVLRNTGTASVTISSSRLAPLDDGFGVVFNAVTIPPNGTSSVIVGFRPDAVGNYSGTLTLYTDEVGNPIRVINLYGIGVKGVLALSPSAINFGSVTVGQDSTVRTWLKNTGGANLTINSLQVIGAAFSRSDFAMPYTIAVGDSTYVDFTFRPTIVGQAQGGVAITLGDGSLVTMGLLGVGTYPERVEGTTAGIQNTLAVTPNPAANDVTAHVTLGSAANGQLQVFDITGHNVLHVFLGQHTEGSFDVSLPVQELPSGTYFVRLTNVSGAGASARLVIQR